MLDPSLRSWVYLQDLRWAGHNEATTLCWGHAQETGHKPQPIMPIMLPTTAPQTQQPKARTARVLTERNLECHRYIHHCQAGRHTTCTGHGDKSKTKLQERIKDCQTLWHIISMRHARVIVTNDLRYQYSKSMQKHARSSRVYILQLPHTYAYTIYSYIYHFKHVQTINQMLYN